MFVDIYMFNKIYNIYIIHNIYIYIYEGCSKFFHVASVIFAKKILAPNFSEPRVYL